MRRALHALPALLVVSCAPAPAAPAAPVAPRHAAPGPKKSAAASPPPPAASSTTAPPFAHVSAGIVDYAVGGSSICAVLESGKVACWGKALDGDGYSADAREVKGIGDAVAVEWYGSGMRVLHAGGSVSDLPSGKSLPHVSAAKLRGECIIDHAGKAACGDSPDRVDAADGAHGVVDVAFGEHHRCFVVAGGHVECSGSNGRGQLGVRAGAHATADMAAAGPDGLQTVQGLKDVKAVAAGSEHSCALLASGRVECWGSGYQGNTGPGDAPARGVRKRIPGIDDAVEISAGPYGWTTCALRRGGRISCWGTSGFWSREAEDKVVTLPALAGAHRLTVTRDMVCALDAHGGLACLGNPPVFAPIEIALPRPARDVISNSDQSCALLEGGDVMCWGRVERTSNSQVTTTVDGAPTKRASGATAIAGGRTPSRLADFCIATRSGKLRCVGRRWPRGHAISGLPDAVEVAMGQSHLCARGAGGKVYCWGSNDDLQLGRPDRKSGSHDGPASEVKGLPPVTKLAAGGDTTCAIAKDQRVFCWGKGELLGDGSGEKEDRSTPRPIPGLRAVDIAMSPEVACVIDPGARIHCWGNKMDGAAGAPSGVSDPGYQLEVKKPFLLSIGGAMGLALGGPDCAIRRGGKVRCWDRVPSRLATAFGTLGSALPVDLPLGHVRALALVGDHGCAVRKDGRVLCFGNDEYGAVGSGAIARWLTMARVEAR